ncbi:peptidase M48 family protein [Halostreptopolyspora alba]|uniref:Peptidase M48 family protein n=2 Tax=Halostreptopolyspora alba TaxID=2487137 RepID=A0A3N0DYR4_9ACTN|nr:peptidase M48 family protein [Nocardiopsaceae bacterium YIM 96095]
MATAQHNVYGTLVGLVCAWFNVPLVVFLSVIGGVLGALAGVAAGGIAGPGVMDRVGTIATLIFPLPVRVDDLLPSAAIQIGGIIGGALGLVSGAGVTAYLSVTEFWRLLYAGDPAWPAMVAVGQVATAAFVAGVYTLYSRWSEPWRLRLSGARRPSRREATWLVPLLRQVAADLGDKQPPRLLMDDSREPSASAGIDHIVLTRGLIDLLGHDEDALAGVIAHEVAHHRAGDGAVMAWSRGIALPLYGVYRVAVWGAERGGPLRWLTASLLWSVTITVRGIVIPAQAKYWRACEYAADAAAHQAGHGPGLHRALSVLRAGFDGARTGWDQTILATHPPLELRLERLEEPGQDYPVLEQHPLAPRGVRPRPRRGPARG